MRRLAGVVVGVLAVAGATGGQARAATYSVACGDVTALRGAIAQANATAAVPDVIDVTGAPCTYTFANASATPQSATPAITSPLRIDAHGATFQRAASAPDMRLFWGYITQVELHDMTVSGGRLTATNSIGGGVLAQYADLTLDGVTVSGNSAAAGGGIYALGAVSNGQQLGSLTTRSSTVSANTATGAAATLGGGGVYANAAPVAFADTTLERNTSAGYAGGIYQVGLTLSATDSAFSQNVAPFGGGGAVTAAATGTYTRTTFDGNTSTATTNGGGLGGALFMNKGSATFAGGALHANVSYTGGGAVYSTGTSDVTVKGGADVSANRTTGYGAAFDAAGGTLKLADGANVHDNAAGFVGGAAYAQGAATTIDGATVAGNTAATFGGGVYANAGTLAVTDTSLTGNGAPSGGGAIVSAGAATTVASSTLTANASGGGAGLGGGVYALSGSLGIADTALSGNTAGYGASAIYTGAAALTLSRSTVDHNSSPVFGALVLQGGSSAIENATISANSADTGVAGLTVTGYTPSGGGTPVPATVALSSSTLADNSKTGSTVPANAIAVNGSAGAAAVRVADTIVADTDSASTAGVAPCAFSNGGTIADDGGNVEWPFRTCGFATTADPRLDGLADNGGPVLTQRLRPGSAAIDLGGADCPSTDARGVPRPDGDGCDAGAYEAPAPQTTVSGPDSPTNAPRVTFESDAPGSTFECRVDGGAWASCASPLTPALASGEHTVDVRATDADGYVDRSPASTTFTVDVTPPEVHVTGVSQDEVDPPTATATFTTDDTARTIECSVDGGARAACTSPFTTGALAPGTHAVTVYAADALGNEAHDSRSVVIDTSPPDTTITGAPDATVYNTSSSTFTFASSRPHSTFECSLDGGAWAACSSPDVVSYGAGKHTFAVRARTIYGSDPTPATYAFTSKKCTLLLTTLYLGTKPTTLCV